MIYLVISSDKNACYYLDFSKNNYVQKSMKLYFDNLGDHKIHSNYPSYSNYFSINEIYI